MSRVLLQAATTNRLKRMCTARTPYTPKRPRMARFRRFLPVQRAPQKPDARPQGHLRCENGPSLSSRNLHAHSALQPLNFSHCGNKNHPTARAAGTPASPPSKRCVCTKKGRSPPERTREITSTPSTGTCRLAAVPNAATPCTRIDSPSAARFAVGRKRKE